jgi:hypothetical protein
MSFTGLTTGTAYSVTLESYGSCTFEHWQDTGSATDPRTFTANGALTLVGVYNCIGASPNAATHSNNLLGLSGQVVVVSAVIGSTLFVGRSEAEKAGARMFRVASRSLQNLRGSLYGIFTS